MSLLSVILFIILQSGKSLILQKKRAFAKYYDNVEDSRDISGFSRFLSGGIGGISSQLSTSLLYIFPQVRGLIFLRTGIYPIETLKVTPRAFECCSTLTLTLDANDE